MPIELELSDQEIEALAILRNLEDEEQAKIEQYAEILQARKGATLVDWIVLLRQMGKLFSECGRLDGD